MPEGEHNLLDKDARTLGISYHLGTAAIPGVSTGSLMNEGVPVPWKWDTPTGTFPFSSELREATSLCCPVCYSKTTTATHCGSDNFRRG